MALIPVDVQSEAALRASDTLSNPTKAVSFSKEAPVHSKLLTYTNDTGGDLADGTVIELGLLNHCLVLPESRLVNTAMGAARTMDVGLQEYTKLDGSVQADDINALLAAVDVSAAADNAMRDDAASLTNPAGLHIEGQTSVLAQINGGTLPNGESITLQLKFVPYRG